MLCMLLWDVSDGHTVQPAGARNFVSCLGITSVLEVRAMMTEEWIIPKCLCRSVLSLVNEERNSYGLRSNEHSRYQYDTIPPVFLCMFLMPSLQCSLFTQSAASPTEPEINPRQRKGIQENTIGR